MREIDAQLISKANQCFSCLDFWTDSLAICVAPYPFSLIFD